MAKTDRIIFNILAQSIEDTAVFYETLCGLKRIYTSDWYIVLTPNGELGAEQSYELGIIDQVHQYVPRAARGVFGGGYLTIVVDDVFAVHERAKDMDIEIIEPPLPTEYGQTRLLVRDPNNVVLDISTPTS